MIGQTISHYKILEKLGEGGMGVVYKAQDLTLDRLVALKFLPPQLTATEADIARFLQEARAASAINHPNVCVIYAVEEHEGQKFIAMEYVDGVTVRKKIARVDGRPPLPVNETLTYAIQIGEALQEAHSKGVVHRDIKPDNVMVNKKNQIKVMDFGLAKLKGSLKLTKTSSTVGTLAYMSPEQIQGSEADHRSDIFAFGVLLFEMLTGHLPFRGEHDAAMVYSIVNEEPQSLLKYLPDASPELERIIRRALEKDSEDRYQSVADMVSELKHLLKQTSKVLRAPQVSTPKPQEKITGRERTTMTIAIPQISARSFLVPGIIVAILGALVAGYFIYSRQTATDERIPIAVIDFTNETGDRELDGLSGLLITALEQSRRLEVLTRSRMFDVLRQVGMSGIDRIDETAGRAICKSANVNVLALGTVKKFGELYTVDLKAIDIQSNRHLFAAKADGKGKETIPSLIDKIAEQMRSELKEPSQDIKGNQQKVAELTTTNLEAYQHYFQGEHLLSKGKWDEAKVEFEKAASIDSTFGLAYYRLAYVVPWNLGAEQIERARQPLKKALTLLDRIPPKERYFVRAHDALLEQGAAAALTILKEIEPSFPNDKELFYNLGAYNRYNSQYIQAEEYIEKALKIDPTFERARDMLMMIYFNSGEYGKTLAEGVKRLSTNPTDVDARVIVADSRIILGEVAKGFADYDSALAYARSRDEVLRVYQHRAGAKVYQGQYKEGRQDYLEALRLNTREVLGQNQTGYFLELSLGLLEDRLHNYDAAVKHFEQSLKFSPNTLRIYRDLGATYARIGNLVKAQFTVDSVLVPRAGTNHRYYNHVMGEIALAKKQYQNAIPYFSKSCGDLTESALYCYPLSKAHILLGDPEGALKVLEGIIKTRLTFSGLDDYQLIFYYPLSIYSLAMLYEQTGEKQKAVETYKKFLNIWSNADKDLPELKDAKSRLAKLKQVATQ